MQEVLDAAKDYHDAVERDKGATLTRSTGYRSHRSQLAQQRLAGALWRYREDIIALIENASRK